MVKVLHFFAGFFSRGMGMLCVIYLINYVYCISYCRKAWLFVLKMLKHLNTNYAFCWVCILLIAWSRRPRNIEGRVKIKPRATTTKAVKIWISFVERALCSVIYSFMWTRAWFVKKKCIRCRWVNGWDIPYLQNEIKVGRIFWTNVNYTWTKKNYLNYSVQ